MRRQDNMANPWRDFRGERKPFIFKEDRRVIDAINCDKKKHPNYQIRTDILPEPYLGNPESKIVLLSANPKFELSDLEWHNKKEFINANRKNITHTKQDYPFYLLNPNFKDSGGYVYWSGILRHLIDKSSLKKVANSVFCIEFFPYHSVKYDTPKYLAWSQLYSFYLVREAIKRNARIVILRAEKEWLKAVPELCSYGKLYHTKSNREVTITENNILPEEGFNRMLNILNSKE